MANMALSLCHITDRMMTTYLQQLEQRFVTEGGIKERMHAARTGYRKQQDERMRQLEADNRALTELLAERDREIARLSEQLARKQSKGGQEIYLDDLERLDDLQRSDLTPGAPENLLIFGRAEMKKLLNGGSIVSA